MDNEQNIKEIEKELSKFNIDKVSVQKKSILKDKTSPVGKSIISPDERKENENNHFHKVKIVFIYFFCVVILLTTLVILLNMLLPEQCRWLSSGEVKSLQHTASIGIVSAFIGRFGNRLVD